MTNIYMQPGLLFLIISQSYYDIPQKQKMAEITQ